MRSRRVASGSRAEIGRERVQQLERVDGDSVDRLEQGDESDRREAARGVGAQRVKAHVAEARGRDEAIRAHKLDAHDLTRPSQIKTNV
eukprot:5749254-Pleurochrysis_carterae.AAC.10